MRCRAPNVDGTHCKREAWDRWPMCKQHVQLAYKELLQSGGLTILTFGVVDSEISFQEEVQ